MAAAALVGIILIGVLFSDSGSSTEHTNSNSHSNEREIIGYDINRNAVYNNNVGVNSNSLDIKYDRFGNLK